MFDGFVDFTNLVFKSFLPWLLRACGRLAEVAGGLALQPPWAYWADLMEEGLDTVWAVEATRNKPLVNAGRKQPLEGLAAILHHAGPSTGLSMLRLPEGRATVEAYSVR